jgi:integrase
LSQQLTIAFDVAHPFVRALLVVAHESGHRIGSIRQLMWRDVDLEAATVTWPAATDKRGKQHQTPLTIAAVAALKFIAGSSGALARRASGSSLLQTGRMRRARAGLCASGGSEPP